MKNSITLLISLLPFLVSYITASPIYEPRQLVPRGTAPLWNESGPHVRDVRQVKTLNCWWAASSLAVLISSQKWVEQMVRYANGSAMTGQSWPTDSEVQVTVWNPNSGQKETFTADHNLISQTEDHPNGNWWHDSIGQGARAMGKTDSFAGVISGPNPQWDPKSGSAMVGLKILTGFETDAKYNEFISVDEFFEYCQKAITGTPVIFNTLDKPDIGVTTPQLGHAHDYAVFNGTVNPDGQRIIWARNSWGSTDGFKLEEVYANTYQIVHLRDWNVLGGGRYDTTHQAAPPALADNATATDNATASASPSANSSSAGNGTNPAANPTAGGSTSSPVNSASSAPAPNQSGATSAPPSNPAGANQPSNSQASNTATAAPSNNAAGGLGGLLGNTSPWQWTSALPGSTEPSWTTTYPGTMKARATD